MKANALSVGYRWWVLLIVSVSPMCGMMISISFSPLVGNVANDLGIGLGMVSFGLLGIPTFATAVGIGVYGFIIDRVGVFPVIISSLIIILISSLLIPVFGDIYAALVAIRIVQGFTAAGLTAAITPAIALWFPRQEMGRAMGFPTIGACLGMMLGLTISPILASAAGSWQTGMALLSGVVLISLLITLPVAFRSKRIAVPGLGEDSRKESVPFPLELFRMRVFWAGLSIMALAMWSNLAFTDLCPGFLAVAPPVGAGYGPVVSGRLMSLPSISGMVGALIAGFLIDKVFHGKNLVVVAIGWVISSIFFTAVLLSSVRDNIFILAPVLFAAGLQNPFINVAVMSFAAKIFSPRIVGRVGGLWMSVSFFAGSAGVMVGSLALHKTETYRLSILILTMVSIIGLLISPFLRASSARPEGAATSAFDRRHACETEG